MKRHRLLALIAATGLAAAGGARAADAAKLAEHVRILSSDAFQGRFPGTASETKTVGYITAEFRKAGLSPGGEIVGGKRTWFQSVPVTESTITAPPKVSVSTPQGAKPWAQGEEIAIRSTLIDGARVTVKDAPLVFLGDGGGDPAGAAEFLKGVDMKGKIALVLFRLPSGPPPKPAVGAKPPLGRMQLAAQQGAAGILLVHEPDVLGYPWQTIATSYVQTRFDVAREGPPPSHVPLEGAVRLDAAEGLFRGAGLDFDTLRKQAESPDFRPTTLAGVTLSVDYPVSIVHGVSHTVVGRLPGAKRPDETVIFGAHWDHEGVGKPDAQGPRIYHGALDNASGVSALIEIARGSARRPRADRSLVFIAWTLEEPGLLGSTWYASHPLYPLAKTVADITFDCLLPIGRARDFSGWGYEDSSLGDTLAAAGARQGRHYTPLGHPEWGVKIRSDHYPLAKKGVPAMLFMSGTDLLQGGKAVGNSYMVEFFAHRYHQPSDRYDADWNAEGTAEDVDLLVDVGATLANGRAWPAWNAASEFKAARDVTAAARP